MIEILKLIVILLGSSVVSNGQSTVNMLSFGGNASGHYFNGEVMAGAVDTQIYTQQEGTLSARYMLRGIDCAGDSCTIFIENNASAGDSVTRPRIVTDSPTLSFLNTANLQGRIANDSTRLEIHIEIPRSNLTEIEPINSDRR